MESNGKRRRTIVLCMAALASFFWLPVSSASAVPFHAVGYLSPDVILDVTHTGNGGDLHDGITAIAPASLQKFNIPGAVLLGAWFGGTFEVSSTGSITITGNDLGVTSQQTASMLAGAFAAAGATGGSAQSDTQPCPFGAAHVTLECPAASVLESFLLPIDDWPSILGPGTFALTATGTARFDGGCSPGGPTTTEGTCADSVTFSHTGTFSLTLPHSEYRYCFPGETSGTFACPDAIPGVNSPPPGASVPGPATVLLLGLGSGALALARRRAPRTP